MTWGILIVALVLVVVMVTGCAVNFGSGGRASVNAEGKREVVDGDPVLEDVLVEMVKSNDAKSGATPKKGK